jgi:diguanylate cyclase (GGDEF)-like protein
MEIKLYVEMFRRNWWMIALTALFALNASLIASFLATPLYASNSRFIISPNPSLLSGRDVITSMEALDKRSIVSTYAEFLNSRRIYDETIAALGLDPNVAKKYDITTVVLPDANILQMTVSGPDPNIAATLANALGQRAIEYISKLYSAYDISVLDPAKPASSPFSPQPTRDAGLALILGLVGGAALAVVSEQVRIPLEAYRQRLRMDNVTGVYNNRYFPQVVADALIGKPYDSLSVAVIDLKGLQEVFETLPPVATQYVLRSVTEILRKELRGNDVIGRLNDTSFTVMLPTTPGSAAPRTFERILHALNEPIELAQYGLQVSLYPAVGGAIYNTDISARELLDRATSALETARRNPDNPVHVWQTTNPFWSQKDEN